MSSAYHSMQCHQAAKREVTKLLRNLAGFLLGFALAAWVCFAHAGYYAEITQSNHANYAVGRTGGCMLTIGMAIYSAAPSSTFTVQALSSQDQTYSESSGSYVISGLYHACNTQALSTTQPNFSSAISDPSITSSGILTGAVGGETTTTDSNPLLTLLGYFFAGMLGFKTGYRA